MKWRKEVFKVIGAVALVCLVASSAQAVVITTTGVWDNPVTGNAATAATVNGEGTDEISWGTPATTGGEQSSYEFNGLTMADVGNVLDGALFPLGDFVHNNFPINNFLFLGTDLTVTVSVPALSISHDFGPFFFTHTETPNDDDPCDEGGTQPCPDLVEVPGAAGGIPFTFMGDPYLLILEGFRESPGGPVVPGFLTDENAVNTATLFARIQLVPEPTTLVLLGLGLLGLGIISRRKKS